MRSEGAEFGRRGLLTPGRVAVVLAITIAVLHGLNLAAQYLILRGEGVLSMGEATFVRVFRVDSEGAIPTWYSSAVILACAVLAWLMGGLESTRRWVWISWRALAAVLFIVALDEAAAIRETVGTHLEERLGVVSEPYSLWSDPLLYLGLLTLLFVPLVVHLPRRTAVLVLSAGAIYIAGALGTEVIGQYVMQMEGRGVRYAALATTEEILEMAGMAIFLLTLLAYWRSRGGERFDVYSPRTIGLLLGAMVIGLGVMHVMVEISANVFEHRRLLGLYHLFNLDHEQNIPAWISSMWLLVMGGTMIAAGHRTRSDRWLRRGWRGLGTIFVLMSIDEFAQLHELSIEPLRDALGVGGWMHFAWIVPGMAVTIVIGLVLVPVLLLRLPRSTAVGLIIAGGLYVGGAIGAESLGGLHMSRAGEPDLTYGLIILLEESLEMVGLLVLTIVLVAYRGGSYGPGQQERPGNQLAQVVA